MCRWLSLCGIQHLRWDAPALGDPAQAPGDGAGDLRWEIIKALALGVVGVGKDAAAAAGREKFAVQEGLKSWEMAPMQPDFRRNRLGVEAAGGDKILDKVPDYVLAHAPLVHLSSEENFWPSPMGEHIGHMAPYEDETLVNLTAPLGLGNLGDLYSAEKIMFLTSLDDVEGRPEWLHSRAGIPVPFGEDDFEQDDGEDDGKTGPGTPKDDTTWWDADKQHPPHRIVDPRKRPDRERRPHQERRLAQSQQSFGSGGNNGDKNATRPGGYSDGPAVLILVDKGSGILDAFWFFFYSYNLGQTVLNIRFGNHVGDWEHCMIRFEHGVPRAMFLSEHAGGKAYAWKAMEKKRLKGAKSARPVIYSAVGSHAMYALPGLHPYVLPFKMLKDITDKGPLWDPAQNHLAFWYDYEVGLKEDAGMPAENRTSLQPAASNPDTPTSWFHFDGYWGDDIYPLSDPRQWRLFGEYHYVIGPLGPKFKYLERRKVCQTEKCRIVESIEAGEKSAWY